MATNNNRFCEQPTYSKDVCDLMRRINALEARCSLVPNDEFTELYDFDVWNGRVYSLVWEKRGTELAHFKIRVNDAVTGAAVDSFAVPVQMDSAPDVDTRQPQFWNAIPRICVGGGYIYMPGALKRDDQPTGFDNSVVTGPADVWIGYIGQVQANTYQIQNSHGKMWRFSVNGDDLQSVEFDEYDQHILREFTDLGQTILEVEYTKPPICPGAFAETFGSPSRGAYARYVDPFGVQQLHYVNGDVYGIARGNRLGFQSGTLNVVAGGDNTGLVNSNLFCCKGDLSSAFAVVESKSPTSFEYGPVLTPWRNRPSTPNPLPTQANDYHKLTESFSIVNIPGGVSLGALCHYGDYLYFDGGGDQASPVFDPTFAKIVADGSEIAHQIAVHHVFTPTVEFPVYANTTLQGYYRFNAALYATDGTDIWALEYTGGTSGVQSSVRRYTLTGGVFIAEYDLHPNSMRYCADDGYLWMGFQFATGFGSGGSTIYQSYLSAYDPATMTEVLRFYFGDPVGQTTWYAYTSSSVIALGTPDNGVSVPDLEALATYHAIKDPSHITQMRDALERIAGFFRAPSGNPLHLTGSQDDDNLYALALGDASDFGATGGVKYYWRRPGSNLIQNVTAWTFDEGTLRFYVAIKDHAAALSNRPGTGVDWQTYWRANTQLGDDLNLLPVEWAEGIEFHVHKTYDIDIGEIDRVVSLLEGTDLMTDP